ncbi:PPOX class probable F420-dependent enzyme [Rhodococcus sp. SMB37]|uniref:TIGR03667 family PPOX class F420-dependent oxidoreductase n=1 Tax=Rhodococcus sp. SMB37 TaxID=2512213 RepID=UPI0006D01BAA|nr:TIGR03667 family PPOX class F420-dependent oxidoreductase [Rhodococcus sp. SMB37]TCN49543.1 PPOX class probable F420-dependent enzyme [Rhodococcus sp. SMB37]
MPRTATPSIPTSVTDRLDGERVVWLTTVDQHGSPVPTPVWFLWSDGTVLMFSQPGTAKLRNIAGQPRVSLNLNSDTHGGQVAVFTASAEADTAVDAAEWDRFVAKYDRDIESLGMTPESFRADYAVPIRFTPERFRGW